ncbi:MAG: acetate--CoA ligase family protein [Alphaproteobacteria bacterium]|nr:acetate--CoA ligase family protein [Alphaproteobacteria bacterium]
MTQHAHPLDVLFAPRSIVFVGVSADPKKTAGAPLRIAIQNRYPGQLYGVHPREERIEGVPCFRSVEELPEVPDCAFISVVAKLVPGVLESCGRKGIKGAVILSSGFEEVEGGADIARSVGEIGRKYGMHIVGPNSEGLWSVKRRTILTFGSAARREKLHHAPIAALTQSGGIGGAIARRLQDGGFGCSYFVSVGNETVTGTADYIDWLAEQDDVRVIVMFIEGLIDGAKAIRAAAKARARGIHLVALKSGNSAVGRIATATHTGKISTAGAIYDAALDQAGVVRVESLTDLIESAKLLCSMPLPPPRGAKGGVAVLSVLGGPRSIMADMGEKLGVPLATFEDSTVAALAKVVPAFGYPRNPVDITGQVVGDHTLFERALDAGTGDANSEGLLIQFGNGGIREARERREIFTSLARKTGLPVVLSLLGDTLDEALLVDYAKQGVAVARDAAEAMRYFGWLYRAREYQARPPLDTERAGRPPLPAVPRSWQETMSLLADAGISQPAWRILENGADLGLLCNGLRFPVALKAMPEQAEHKTEHGLVVLNLPDADAVAVAAIAMQERLARLDPRLRGGPLLVQEMVSGGVEAVVTAARDPDFGVILAVGTGGTLVELLGDVGYVVLPASADEVKRRIGTLKLSRLLAGFRGAESADTEALARAALSLGSILQRLPSSVQAIELNPLLVMPAGKGVAAIDVLVREG